MLTHDWFTWQITGLKDSEKPSLWRITGDSTDSSSVTFTASQHEMDKWPIIVQAHNSHDMATYPHVTYVWQMYQLWESSFNCKSLVGISYFVCGWIHFISFQSTKKCSTYPKRFCLILNLKVKISHLFERQHTNKMWAPPTKIKLTLCLINHNTIKPYRGVAV
jgi:hypothetical protein